MFPLGNNKLACKYIPHKKKCQLGNKGEKKLFLARRKIGVGVGLNFNIHFDEAK